MVAYIVGSSSKDILAEALYSVVSQLTEDVFGLPTPLIIFFRATQEAADKKEITIPHDCVGLKVGHKHNITSL